MFFSRGVPLPDWGSIADAVLRQRLFRERSTEVARFEIDLYFKGATSGYPAEALGKLVETCVAEYRSRVFDEAYSMQYVVRKLESKLQELREQLGFINRLKRLERS